MYFIKKKLYLNFSIFAVGSSLHRFFIGFIPISLNPKHESFGLIIWRKNEFSIIVQAAFEIRQNWSRQEEGKTCAR